MTHPRMRHALKGGNWDAVLCRLTQRCMSSEAAAGLCAHEAFALASVAAKCWERLCRLEVASETVVRAVLLVMFARLDWIDDVSPTSGIEFRRFQDAVTRAIGVATPVLRAMEPRVGNKNTK